MKKKPKLKLEKFNIAKLNKPNSIYGGTGTRTSADDPNCGVDVTEGGGCN